MVGWALQDAKGRFSELVDCARTKGPQLVTRRGKEAVVVVAVEQFRQFVRMKGEEGLVDFFHNSPLAELDSTWLERDRDVGRSVPL
jgi:prevent-host-death family protein